MPAVPSQFLPPDPHAADDPAPQPATGPAFLPPNATLAPAAGQRQNGRATAALAFGAGGLGLLFFSAGMLFFLTVPASITGWILGRQAKRRATGRDQANLAVTIGVVGVILGVVAGVVWILLVVLGDVSGTGEVQSSGDGQVHFDVVRLVALLL